MTGYVPFPSDPSQEVVVPLEPLRKFLADVLERKGMFRFEAEIAADRMLDADMRGQHAHGCRMTTELVEAIDRGDIDPRAELITEVDTPAAAVINAGEGVGQVAATRAMQTAIKKAKEVGTGTVLVKRSRDFGSAASYVQLAVDAGMIGFCTTSTPGPSVAAYGSHQPATADNSLAWGVPTREGAPLVLDLSCAGASWAEVKSRVLYGMPVPEGWVIDAEGRHTTDPNQAKTLLPAGGFHGFGLSLICSVLAGPLAGGRMPSQKEQGYLTQPVEHFFYVIDVSQLVDSERFLDRVQQAVDQIRSLPPAEGFDRVLVPGEVEWERIERCKRDGLPLHRDTVSRLTELAERLGIAAQWTP